MVVKTVLGAGVMISVLLLAGCSTTAQRGESESPPQYAESDSQCRDIAGSYQAVPHPLGPQQQETRALLAMTLLPPHDRLEQTREVILKPGDDGSWQVQALGSDSVLLAKQRYAADSGVFSCDDGQLAFHPDKLPARAAGIPWDRLILRKTEDGSLMLRKGGLFSGLIFMVFPMSISTDNWYLFKPAP